MTQNIKDFQRGARVKLQHDIDEEVRRRLRERAVRLELEMEQASYRKRHDRVLWGAVGMFGIALVIALVLELLK